MAEELAALREQFAKLESLRSLLGDELTDRKQGELTTHIHALEEAERIARNIEGANGREAGLTAQDTWQVFSASAAPPIHPDRDLAETLLEAYLRILAAESSQMPLSLVDPRFVGPTAERDLTLPEVYVDLDVIVHDKQQRRREPFLPKGSDSSTPLSAYGEAGSASVQRCSVMDAISRADATRLVLLGDPGSGKTTFVNYLTYSLASEDAPASSQPALKGLLPVRLLLREVAARAISVQSPERRGDILWRAIRIDIADRLGEDAARILQPHLMHRVLREGGLILLDGLDEVPEAEHQREHILSAVAAMGAALPGRRGRIIVTARPYAYADPRWRLAGFETLELAPFSEAQAERFVARWHQAAQPTMGWDDATAEAKSRYLQESLRERPHVLDLAGRPLLLTLITTLHAGWGQFPADRTDLYEETVDLLLDRWQRGRQSRALDGQPVLEPGFARAQRLDPQSIRQALHTLAYRVHRRQAEEPRRTRGPADISEAEILSSFAPVLPPDVNPRVLLQYTESRAGILVHRAPGVYAFAHRSFQEYLTACHLADQADFAHEIGQRVWFDLAWWREVFLLGVGKARRGGLGNAVHLVGSLVQDEPPDPGQTSAGDEPEEAAWQVAALAGQALIEVGFPPVARGAPDFEAVLGRVSRWLAALIETADALAPLDRAQAGNILGRLGDRRAGVGLLAHPAPVHALDARPLRATLPDILWVGVPSGPSVMGSAERDDEAHDDERPLHTVRLPAFLIARYPITNAQFRPFVESGGYDDPRYWTSAGWAWRHGEQESELPLTVIDDDLNHNYTEWLAKRPVERRQQPFYWDHARWGVANRPVVGITWYEALAYCRWLTVQMQASNTRCRLWRNGRIEPLPIRTSLLIARLPSEAEWEKAARGPDGRRFPWGDEWATNRANSKEAGIGETCSVGTFPAGMSPYGAHDMVGNIWEWTRTKWGKTSVLRSDYGYPYESGDGREELAGPDLRVVRGGSWLADRRTARCAYRYRYLPGDFSSLLGFRPMLSLEMLAGHR